MGAETRAEASAAISNHLASSSIYRDARTIAVYLSVANEVSLARFIERAHHDCKEIFAPRVADQGSGMQFIRLRGKAKLQSNRFGIEEPAALETEAAEPGALHLVLLPLVAFDSKGNRLGMGAGYYDRAFAFRRDTAAACKGPVLCGAGFSCQRFDAIEKQDWDVPLDYIVTEDGIEQARQIDTNSLGE